MNQTALVELVEAVFIGIALLGQYHSPDNSKSVLWLRRSLITELFSLITDAIAYIITGTSCPFVFRYVFNLLAYTMGELVIVFFLKYCEEYISEKTKLNKLTFLIPVAVTVFSLAATAIEFFAGHIIVFENHKEVAEYGVPTYIRFIQLLVLIYSPAVAVYKRKSIDSKAVFLFIFYSAAPSAAIIASYFFRVELSVAAAAFALMLVATFLQKEMTLDRIKENAIKAAVSEETDKARKDQIAKLSGAESLYIVDREKDTFQVLFWSRYHSENYDHNDKYSVIIKKCAEKDVFESDREKFLNELDISSLSAHLENKDEYRFHFRDISSGVPHWYEMRALKLSESEILISFADNNKKIILDNFQNMVNEDFFALFSVNLDTDLITVLKDPGYYPTVEVGKTAQYSKVIKEYALTQEGETKDVFLRLADIENVKKVLFTETKRSYSYKSSLGEKKEWITVSTYLISRHEDNTPEEFILSFSVIDKLSADSHELREKLKEINHIIGALSEDYTSVYYVPFNKNKLEDKTILYRESDFLKKYIPEWENEKSFTKRLDLLTENLVYGPDREMFIKETRRERVMGILEKSGTCYVSFRMLIDSEIVYYQLQFSSVKENGETAGFVIGLHSIDEQMKKDKEHQNQLEKKQEELQTALEAAQSASMAKTSFLFNMSHDIRTPMNAIIGFTDMALKHLDDGKRVEDCLKKTQLSGSLLLSLINDILDMSRIESGKIQMKEEEMDVYLSFERIEDALLEMAEAKKIDLSFEFIDIKDRYVCMDISLCIRIFVNIITNAIKYTGEGGFIRVKCQQKGREEDKGIYQFTFEDNGIGMSEEFTKHAFDEFSRENTSTVSGIQGTGLGLAVCRSFVLAMNGTIECQSRQGKGSIFTVTLPLKISEREEHSENKEKGEEAGSVSEKNEKAGLAGKRVLLVEDNELNREIAECILSEEKMIVETASDGSVAVDILKEKGADYFDLILMDIQMPIMNGYEATGEIRKMYPDSKVPIIALSANAFEEDRLASIAAGMNDHVGKPIDIEVLNAVMEKYI